MKEYAKKAAAVLLAGTMLLGAVSGCTQDTPTGNGSPAPSGSGAPEASQTTGLEYPVTPEELGSGEVKWSEEKTDDGWMKVTNTDGETLGYSPDSGVSLIQVDGYAFKDLNKNGQLDAYEDWRQDDDARAEALASEIPMEMVQGLMFFSSMYSFAQDGSDAFDTNGNSFKAMMEEQHIRNMQNFASAGYDVGIQATWNNNVQAYAESLDYGIPVNVSSNSISLSGWAGPLALAATFDPDYVQSIYQMQGRQYSAQAVTTLLGPQVDLTADPRWRRIASGDGTFGEDPALSRDMSKAAISGLQSTYDEDGNDLGWGNDSVVTMIKHFPGDGSGESGRESHDDCGKYAVYPGNGFETALIPFIDGGMNLDSLTGETGAVMTSYSIAWSDDGSLGELVGSAFSEYKVQLLRSYGFDGVICTDWGVLFDLNDPTAFVKAKPWGVEDLTKGERAYKAIKAGIDQFGGVNAIDPILDAYQLGVEEMGEEAADARFRESARRILKLEFHANLFDYPYLDVAESREISNSEEAAEAARESQLKSIVMLKNENNVIKASESEELPTVYIPLQYSSGAWSLPVEQSVADRYFTVVTDTVKDPSGPADKNGNPTYTEEDIVRASTSELAACDYALVMVNSPENTTRGYDNETGKYVPRSLQYGPYTANSASVRTESIAGDMIEQKVDTTYGVVTSLVKENRSYYGESAQINNASDLDAILYAAENMPADAPVIVAINAQNPMIFSEFEDKVDAILMGFAIDNEYFLDIVTGKVEPTALLPMQMPANMETVEAQLEDVPRDMECHVDAAGNTYDFGFGMNWSGVIQDERTEKYCVPPLTEPETQPVSAEG